MAGKPLGCGSMRRLVLRPAGAMKLGPRRIEIVLPATHGAGLRVRAGAPQYSDG